MTVELRKLIYLCYELEGRTKEQTRRVLLDDCAPELSAGTERLQMNIDDPLADVRSPAPSLLREAPVRAQVNLWIEDPEARWPLEDVLRRAGFQISGYLVDEHVYTDYGGNQHAEPRDWPDGERSPGVLAVTLMERPKPLSREEWINRWHNRQSPMSEAMQPRSRYVRNVIERALTPAAPPFEGIVEEAWPSMRHVTNPFLFYGANSPWELARNMTTMLRSVTSFLDLGRIRTVTMSEYFLHSGFDTSVGDSYARHDNA